MSGPTIDPEVADAYARTAAALPPVRGLVNAPANALELRGEKLVDPTWLGSRVSQTARIWRCDDARVPATLWWYSASSALLAVPAAMLLSTGLAPDPTPERLTFTLRPDGSVATVRSAGILRGPEEFADRLRAAMVRIIGWLAAVAKMNERSLWAIATDAIANRALDAATALGGPSIGSALAVRIAERIGAPLLTPRFVDVVAGEQTFADPEVEPPPGARRFVRRNSCCLLYRSPAVAAAGDPEAAERAKCVSCPSQLPALRLARLGALVG